MELIFVGFWFLWVFHLLEYFFLQTTLYTGIFSNGIEMPFLFCFVLFCRHLTIWFSKNRLNILQCQEIKCFLRYFSFAFWVGLLVFFPLNMISSYRALQKLNFLWELCTPRRLQIPVQPLQYSICIWAGIRNAACEGSSCKYFCGEHCLCSFSVQFLQRCFSFPSSLWNCSIPPGGEAVSHLGGQHRAAESVKSARTHSNSGHCSMFLIFPVKSGLWGW